MKHCSKLRKNNCITFPECMWIKSLGCRTTRSRESWIKKCTKVPKKLCAADCTWIKTRGCKKLNLKTIFTQIVELPRDKRHRLISSFSKFMHRKRNLTLLESIKEADDFFTNLETESRLFLDSLKNLTKKEVDKLSKQTLDSMRTNEDCTLIKIFSCIQCMDVKKISGLKVYTKIFVDCVIFLWNTVPSEEELERLENEASKFYRSQTENDSEEKLFANVLASS